MNEGLKQAIMKMLPPIEIDGKIYYPGISDPKDGVFYSDRNGRSRDVCFTDTKCSHCGIDINYRNEQGGSAPINNNKPNLYSPVDGEVYSIDEKYGTVIIKADDGSYHAVTHLLDINVKKGDKVKAGETQLGKMGGKGPRGDYQYRPHVDYKIIYNYPTKEKCYVDPESYYAEKVRRNLREGTRRIDPLVIDLDGDGIELTDIKESTAMFDLTGSGFANRVGWDYNFAQRRI